MPLDRQTAIESARHQPGRRDATELVVPNDVNTLVVRVQLDSSEWSTVGKRILFGIERLVGGEWQHVVSSEFITFGSRPTNRDGSDVVELSLRQMLQSTRQIDGRQVKADDFEWAGQTVRPFVQTSDAARFAVTIEGQLLTDRQREDTTPQRTGQGIP